MVLNEEIHSVELIYAGQEVAVTETSTSFYNERQKVEIDLTKSLEVDEDYGVGNNGEIFDVSFGLYAAEELTAADGTTIPADGLIEVITLDENGHGKAVSDLPMGSYYVQEISTNAAYLKMKPNTRLSLSTPVRKPLSFPLLPMRAKPLKMI